jgi:hypothetical protein
MRNTREDIQPVDYTNMSCVELALVDEQEISIDHSIASAAASLPAKMLVTKDLRYHCAYVSLEAGTQFVYNSPRILKKYLKAAKGSVSPPILKTIKSNCNSPSPPLILQNALAVRSVS